VREGSLVVFTLLTQAAVGTCWSLLAVRPSAPAASALLLVSLLAALAGLAASFLHLGRPSNAWRALSNLRTSWLSREILFASAFTGMLAAALVFASLPGSPPSWTVAAEWAGGALGLALVWSMAMAYRLRTVPAWNAWTTNVAFLSAALGLGGLSAAALLADPPDRLLLSALLFHLVGAATTLFWLRGLPAVPARPLLLARFTLSALVLAAGSAALGSPGSAPLPAVACLLAFAAEAAGRSLFYGARVRVGL
jgi:anaerobic dimethyl sulfoxide reductase subunit C